MTSIQQHATAEQALGATALESLQARNLLRRMAGPEAGREAGDRPDRVAATISGAALGDAFVVAGAPSARQWLADASPAAVTAVTQSLVLSAETWCDAGWSAPALLSDRFGNVIGGMRQPGEALRRAIAARAHGAAWYQAATRSYGDVALTRAVAVGLVRPGALDELGLAASLDAAVTHASPRATACAAALAGIIAVLVERPDDQSARECIASVVEAVDHRRVRDALRAAVAPTELPPTGSPEHGVRPEAIDVLSLALWSALLSDDPAMVLATAAEFSGRHRAAVAVAGALFGAIHGRAALPPRAASLEGADAYTVLAGRIADRLDGRTAGGARIWFLLDRSGSMADIAADVVTGFDRFFADQREVAGDATVTIVQFDDHDPHDVVVDARPIASVPTIAGRFEPRGCTPLYDAIARLLDRAEADGGVDADQLLVVMTDGYENASRTWDQPRLFRRISDLRDRGWTFVFLGANQDSYATGGGLGVGAGNVSNFVTSADGVSSTYDGLTRTVTAWRGKDRATRNRDRDDFWGGRKEAEE